MINGIGEAISNMVFWFMVLLFVAVPLAVWKAIDIIVWILS